MNRRIRLFPGLFIAIAFALITGGCGGVFDAPPLPDRSNALQRGMTLAEVQKSMGTPGVVRQMPRDASHSTEAEFDRPPRYPDLNILVYLGAWGGRRDSVAGWKFHSQPTTSAAPEGR